ncbi:hypothetical protein K2X85_08875 [bacterium]|nr:hypothetical protein [bacterium]
MEILSTVGSKHWGVIDSVSAEPREIESAPQLLTLASGGSAASSASIPRLLQRACAFMDEQHAGTCEIWIVSDRAAHDRASASGVWQVVRDALTSRKD